MKQYKFTDNFTKVLKKAFKHLLIILIATPFLSYLLMFLFHVIFDTNYQYLSAETETLAQLIVGAVLAAAASIYANIISFYNGDEHSDIGGKWTDRIINNKPMKRVVIDTILAIFLAIGVIGIAVIWLKKDMFYESAKKAIENRHAMSGEMIIAQFIQTLCIFLVIRYFNLHEYIKNCACPNCKAAFAFTTYSYGQKEETKKVEAKITTKSQAVGTINKGEEVVRTIYEKVPTGVQTRIVSQTNQKVSCQCGYCKQLATKFNVSITNSNWKNHKIK
ncbi:MAG: hypothetical protein IJX17_04260 [Clostridia bacterium]|nr:hypothetical protein [Clostridia bacterium]